MKITDLKENLGVAVDRMALARVNGNYHRWKQGRKYPGCSEELIIAKENLLRWLWNALKRIRSGRRKSTLIHTSGINLSFSLRTQSISSTSRDTMWKFSTISVSRSVAGPLGINQGEPGFAFFHAGLPRETLISYSLLCLK